MSESEVIERVWDAPLDLVWELWTTAEGIASWFGPRGFQVEVSELDLRVGGTFRYTMRAIDPQILEAARAQGRPDGFEVSSTITELEPPHKMVYDSPFGAETMTTSATFSEVEGGVKLRLVVSATAANMLRGAMGGWASSLDRLGEQLPS